MSDVPSSPPLAGVSPRAAGALRSPAAWLRLLAIGAGGLALDLWSKDWAFHTLRQGGRVVIIPGLLEFQTMLNPGALFGIGGGQTTLFLVASVFALVLVMWMFAQSEPRRRMLHIALGGILAGALGNMHDRAFVRLLDRPFPDRRGAIYMTVAETRGERMVLREYPAHEGAATRVISAQDLPNEVGFVRDFIKIPTKLWGERDLWPWVFNVADMLLIGGVSILAIHLLREKREETPEPAPVAPAPP